MIIHEHPDDAVLALASDLLDLKKKNQRIQINGRDKYYYLSAYEYFVRTHTLQDLWFMIRVVLGWHFLDEILVGKEMMSFQYGEDNYNCDNLILYPRGHGKTMFSIAKMIHHPLVDQDCALINISSTAENSQQIGATWSDIITGNDMLKAAFPDILPSKDLKTLRWGKSGYYLPNRKPRRDPTLMCLSVGSKLSGKRGDKLIVDDIIDEAFNNPQGLKKCEDFFKVCLPIVAPHGVFEMLGTRYSDGDLYGKLLEGTLLGKQGRFKCLVKSCFENDDIKKAIPIYQQKARWTSKLLSGFTSKQLLNEKQTLGNFFNAQYRNNPAPDEDQTINYSDLTYYTKKELPEFGNVIKVGVEITGGGRPIYQTLLEEAELIDCLIPADEISNPRRVGESKIDRIISVLDPVISQGRLKVTEEQCPKKDPHDGTLGYEIRRLGVAKHDDIVDALHNNILHVSKNYFPREGDPCPIYISVDLAWNDKKESDFTVALALTLLPDETYMVLDYIRFKEKSPRVIANRIIEFYRKWDVKSSSNSTKWNASNSLAFSYK